MLYAYFRSFPQHESARAWLEHTFSGDVLVGLPWATIHAFLRIGTNPRALTPPLAMGAAAAIVAEWLARPIVRVVVPGERYWGIFRRLLEEGQATSALVADAHLAALAIEQGFTMCTNDRDFLRFAGLRVEFPLKGRS